MNMTWSAARRRRDFVFDQQRLDKTYQRKSTVYGRMAGTEIMLSKKWLGVPDYIVVVRQVVR